MSKKLCVWRRSRAKFASATLEFLAKFSRFWRAARSTSIFVCRSCAARDVGRGQSSHLNRRSVWRCKIARSAPSSCTFFRSKICGSVANNLKICCVFDVSAPKIWTASLRQPHDVGAVLDRVGGVYGAEKVVRLASHSRKICVGNA